MKLKKSIKIVLITLSLALSQTGCALGFVFWPLWIASGAYWCMASVVGATGLGISYVGGAFTYPRGHANRIPTLINLGSGMFIGAGVMEATNPGRTDFLNELPTSDEIADQAHVKLTDIKSYNRELDQIRQVGLELIQDLQVQAQRSDLKQITSLEVLHEKLHHDPQIDRLAVKYGFESSEDFFNSFKKKKLPPQVISNFARNMGLTEGQTRLLLYYGFGVNC